MIRGQSGCCYWWMLHLWLDSRQFYQISLFAGGIQMTEHGEPPTREWTTSSGGHCPANTRRWPNVGLLLDQRRRRWVNIKPTLCQRLVFVKCPPSCHCSATLDQNWENFGLLSETIAQHWPDRFAGTPFAGHPNRITALRHNRLDRNVQKWR